ncbi:MAG: hypothetical protein EOO43_02365 [Flavobacterium sp.]|nr:MAG: hypothetical protein EOO43_02365 [Flavobacterium sp.]
MASLNNSERQRKIQVLKAIHAGNTEYARQLMKSPLCKFFTDHCDGTVDYEGGVYTYIQWHEIFPKLELLNDFICIVPGSKMHSENRCFVK